MENKSFRLEIKWTNTILQEFWKEKQYWTERKSVFYEINCEPFHKCECFVSEILLISMLNSNRIKRKNIRKHSRAVCFSWNKKWTVCDFSRKPFDKCQCFASWVLLVNMLNSNVKKLKKHNFKQKPLEKFVFHETKKWIVCGFL